MTAKLKTHRLPLGEPSAKLPATALLVTLALLGWSCISAPSPPEDADATLAIVDVTIIDGTGAPPQTGRTLLVRDSIVIDEAKDKGLRVAGHVPVEVPVSEAVLAGHHSVEHLIGIALESSSEEHALRERAAAEAASLRESKISREEAPRILGRFYDLLRYEPLESADPAKAAQLYSLLAENQGWQVPTLVVRRPVTDSLREQLNRELGCFPPFMRQLVLPQNAGGEAAEVRIRERHEAAIAIVRDMHRAGVPLLAGSDGGNPASVPAFSLHDELELFVDAGLTPLEALQTATRNAAEFLGREDTGGTIESGKIADLVLLEADPLADIRNTRRIEAVVMDGRLLPRSEIISILSACAAAPED